MTTTYLVVFIGAILLSFVLTRAVRNIAIARGWVSVPSLPRHIHTASIPRLGGIAIFLAFAVVAGVLAATSATRGVDPRFSPRTILYILIPGTMVFLLGLYDDLRPVKRRSSLQFRQWQLRLLFSAGLKSFSFALFGSHAWVGLRCL